MYYCEFTYIPGSQPRDCYSYIDQASETRISGRAAPLIHTWIDRGPESVSISEQITTLYNRQNPILDKVGRGIGGCMDGRMDGWIDRPTVLKVATDFRWRVVGDK